MTDKPLRVLLVEDNEEDALLLAQTLRASGYAPEYARVDKADALKQALSAPVWDFVIIEDSLSAFCVLDAFEILRASGYDLPCFVVSKMPGEQGAVAALRAGARDYLGKNDLARLGPALERELREAAGRAERRYAEDALRRSHAELEAQNVRLKRAMAETHHRVKNNLQIISALVELQMQEGAESVPASALARVGQHARALALLHDLLTWEAKGEAEMDTISARDALEKMIPLMQATSGGRRIRYAATELVRLPVKVGASLALLINELISNALKHGKGDIEVELNVDNGTACLEVRDDGPGFPADFTSEQAANTGLELVESIGRWDLGGQTSYETRVGGGARVCITFPLNR